MMKCVKLVTYLKLVTVKLVTSYLVTYHYNPVCGSCNLETSKQGIT